MSTPTTPPCAAGPWRPGTDAPNVPLVYAERWSCPLSDVLWFAEIQAPT